MSPEQIAAVVEQIRERVRARHHALVDAIPGFELPSLDSLELARGVAETKAASIGLVNPRPPGVMNGFIQGVKRLLARSLNWMVRDQVEFNRAVLRYFERQLEVSSQQNQSQLQTARTLDNALSRYEQRFTQLEERLDRTDAETMRVLGQTDAALEQRMQALRGENSQVWSAMRQDFQSSLDRAVQDLHRQTQQGDQSLQRRFFESLAETQAKASKEVTELQERLWADLERVKHAYEKEIHTEVRLLRQRLHSRETHAPSLPATVNREPVKDTASPGGGSRPGGRCDYSRFEARFRGDDSFVRARQEFYMPYFAGCRKVADLGCGRGEFLELLGEKGISAVGVDFDGDAVAACRDKGLEVKREDLFAFLAELPGDSLDGVFCSHVVEHLDTEQLQQLIELAAAKLTPNGVIAIETPNPDCLAIFAGDFYVDPTHQRPVPSRQLHFFLQEAGFGQIEVQERHPARDSFPEIAALGEVPQLKEFQNRFFGGLDYAIIGRRLES